MKVQEAIVRQFSQLQLESNHITIISRGKKGRVPTAQIVRLEAGRSITRHVQLHQDGLYHWFGNENGRSVEEVYAL